jgi:RHS repeat-associated protein
MTARRVIGGHGTALLIASAALFPTAGFGQRTEIGRNHAESAPASWTRDTPFITEDGAGVLRELIPGLGVSVLVHIGTPEVPANTGGAGSVFSETPVDPAPASVPKDPCAATDNPVVIATGNKILRETDLIVGGGEMPLQLTRTYNKEQTHPGVFGRYWTSDFDYKLFIPSTNTLRQYDPSGAIYTWVWSTDRWKPQAKPDSAAYIIQQGANWIHYREDGGTEVYEGPGEWKRIVSVKNRYGIGWTFSYDYWDEPKRVTHTSGRYVSLTWNSGRVTAAADSSGNAFTYAYDPVYGYLNRVNDPDGNVRVYLYELAQRPNAVTGITVNFVRYSYYGYHPDGRVWSSSLAHGAESDTFNYGPLIYGAGITHQTFVTNAGGAQSTYTYAMDATGRRLLQGVSRSGVTNCPNAAASYTYDSNGFLASETDWNGNQTTYTYDASGRLLNKTTGIHASFPGQQRLTTYEWLDANRLRRIRTYGASTAQPVAETVYTYYSLTSAQKGRPASVTVYNRTPNGVPGQAQKTTYTYTMHPNGLVATMTVDGPLAGTSDYVRYTWSAQGDLISVANGLGHTVSYANYNAQGLPGQITDANGFVTSYTYSGRGRVKTETRVISGQNATTAYEYDGHGNVTKTTLPNGQTITNTYDAAGRLIKTVDSSYPLSRIEIDYNGLSKPVSRRILTTVGTTTTTDYSASWTYDQIGRLTAGPGKYGQQMNYTYDPNGNLLEAKDPALRTTTMAYNSHDELIQSADPLNGVTRYSYDAAGRIASVTDPRNNTTSYKHDGFGNRVELQSPDTGLTRMAFDNAGRRTSLTRANGAVTSYGYDLLDRPISISAGGQTQNYVYDSCTNGKGRVCEINSTDGSLRYQYRNDGALASQVFDAYGTSYTTVWTHDLLGRTTQITYPGGNQVRYVYDHGRLTTVQSVIGGTVRNVASSITYAPFGPVRQLLHGNGVYRNRAWDELYRHTSITASVGGIHSLSYGRNSSGEITQITNGLNASWSQTYNYDANSRLTSFSLAAVGTRSFGFDANHNVRTRAQDGGTDTYNTQTASNKLLSVTGARPKSFTNDTLGNRTQKTGDGGTHTYTFDPFNRLASATTANGLTQYKHNPLNQRTAKLRPEGVYRYLYALDGLLLGETRANQTSLSTEYIWLNGEPIGIVRDGVLHYVHNDHLGRPEVVTNQSKTVVHRAVGLPYDRLTVVDNFGGLNLGYPGQYWDESEGLWYNHNRYFDPSTTKYIQSDPIGLDGGINTYAYVNGNPVSLVDPSGLCPQCVVGAVVGALGGAGWDIGRQIVNFQTINWSSVGASFVGGAILGGITGATLGLGTAAVAVSFPAGNLYGVFVNDVPNAVHYPWEDARCP